MAGEIRVRYAPSPTGDPHVGNIRTALFNWLFGRHTGGSFILRIEDTDQTRLERGALEAILESLRWLGLNWDEGPEVGGSYGPYFQSERLNIYKSVAERLMEQGDAYLCYCSPERLAQMREEQMRQRRPPGYDRHCRNLGPAERARFEADGVKPVVRFKVPLEGRTIFQDLIHGEVAFENVTLDDFILLKSDGYPTYHLANVTDDHLMRISHVLRADEWLPSTPRHCLLYDALGYPRPTFAHLPMILGRDRTKLSKRHGATSALDYKDRGYLPEAVLNFLALLGWSLDDKTELLSREELVRHFSLERIGKTPAIFDQEKLTWMNGVYIRQLPLEELLERALPFLRRALPFWEEGLPAEVERPLDQDYLHQILPLVQDRLRYLKEITELTLFFFLKELNYEASLLLGKDMSRELAARALEVSKERLLCVPLWEAASLEGVLRPLAEELGMKTGPLFGILRVACTGRTAAPPLFATMAVLGRERCLSRIDHALAKLRALA